MAGVLTCWVYLARSGQPTTHTLSWSRVNWNFSSPRFGFCRWDRTLSDILCRLAICLKRQPIQIVGGCREAAPVPGLVRWKRQAGNHVDMVFPQRLQLPVRRGEEIMARLPKSGVECRDLPTVISVSWKAPMPARCEF